MQEVYSLIWVDRNGNSVTQSQLAILRAAACAPSTPALAKDAQHHDLVKLGALLIAEDEKNVNLTAFLDSDRLNKLG